MSLRTAIVTTLCDTEEVLASFVKYHLSIGFDHLFLFFDNPEEPIPQYVLQNPNITVFRRDQLLSYAWETTALFLTPAIARSIEQEVMTRQLLNAEIALRHAHEMGISWLLHIDIDELFYSTQGIQVHFQQLESRQVDAVHYLNLEAIPESAEITDYFQTVSLFKANPKKDQTKKVLSDHADYLETIPQLPNQFFNFYSNGKAAVKITERSLPKGCHNFTIPPGGKRIVESEDPLILHYPVCGLGHFIRKYTSRYLAGEKWFGEPVHGFNKLPAYYAGLKVMKKGNPQEIEQFYIDNYIISDKQHIQFLLDTGLSKRITDPINKLKARASQSQEYGLETG